MRRTIYLLCAIALLGACSQEEFQNENLQNSKEVVFTTSFENCNTRTYINESNQLRWNADDRITIFNGNTLNQQYKFTGETGDNGGTFSKVSSEFGTGNDLSCHYAIYPYDSNNKISDEGIITTTLPATQSYVEKSFGLGANTMVAATQNTDDTFLAFKNVGGYLKLSLYGTDITVKSITLKGNNGEKIAGKATITHSYGSNPSVTMAEEATDEITLDCGTGVTVGSTAETATDFWIVVPPTTFTGGFCITITNSEGGQMVKTTTKSVTIARNGIQPMTAFELKDFSSSFHVETAGTLASLVGDANKYLITSMKVTGSLNAADIATIRDMAGSNVALQATEGILTHLDISNATIVEDTENAYLLSAIKPEGYSYSYKTEENTVGPLMFARTKLESIQLPSNTKIIDPYAFDGCASLTSVSLPDGLTGIGEKAFYNCTSLPLIVIPTTVNSLGSSVFWGCSNLAQANIPDGITELNRTFSRCALTSITIPSSVTSIIYAFYGNAFTEVSLPANVTNLEGAFSHCTNLRSITIPNKVENMKQTFSGCTSLESISIPSSVTTLNQAFMDCTNLHDVEINGAPDLFMSFFGCTSLESVTIPSGIQTLHSTFSRCTALKTVLLPNSVTEIDDAFSECTSLETIELPNSVTKLSGAFSGCTSLEAIELPNSVTDLGGAFSGCTFTTITIPGNVENLHGTFSGCSALRSITIPNSVKYMFAAFKDCTSLETITIPGSVIDMEDAFWNSGLSTVVISEGVTNLDWAFINCHNLTSIEIPSSVNSMEDSFSSCTSLASIYCKPTTAPTISEYTFTNVPSELKIYVPTSAVNAYKAADTWSSYSSQIQGYDF